MPGTDAEIGDILRTTLTELFGVRVWWTKEEPGVFHIRAGGRGATVTRDEISKVYTSLKGFTDLLKQKLDL